MELDWSTFLLEIINFLVLVWILKRFLYQPVLDVIARRRKDIADRLADADKVQQEAESLKSQYEGRLADWDQERRQARDNLAQELDSERVRQLTLLQTSLEHEREKAEVAGQRQQAEQQRATEHHALQQGAAFAGRLLAQASGRELEARLLDLLLDQLSQLSGEQLSGLRQQWGEPPAAIEVSSAFDLSEEQRGSLETALHRVSGLDVPLAFRQDKELLAGLHIVIGAWVLSANVRDELKGFAEFAHVPR